MDGRLWVVRSREHVKPGKGGAFVQMQLKELGEGGAKTNYRARSSDMLEAVKLRYVGPFQVLYTTAEDNKMHLMHMGSYEQIELGIDAVGDRARWIVDGMELTVAYHGSVPVQVELPSSGVYEVVEALPIREDTRNDGSGRQVRLANGVTMRAAKFIETGDWIRVRLDDGEYLEKAEPPA